MSQNAGVARQTARRERRPNLFIVGAPRCGTTSMYRYLQQHPDIFMCREKAPNYWSRDVFPLNPLREEEDYLELFAAAGDQPWVGEASVSYLYSRVAARDIRAFSPDARIIIMLRNPVDMMRSLHQRRVELGQEPLFDFEAAVAAQEERRAGRRPGGAGLYLYTEVGAYAEQVARYLDAFGRDAVHVILHEDLMKDVPATLGGVLRFLGVREDVSVDLTPVNESVRIRHPLLHRMCLRLWHSPLTPAHVLADLVAARNKEPGAPPPLKPAFRRKLAAQLAPDVEQLARLLGRDLSHWSRLEE